MFWEAQPRFNRSEPGGYFRGLYLFIVILYKIYISIDVKFYTESKKR